MMKGFTLVELLIVVGIIGILSTALLITLNPIEQAQKGRDVQRKSDLGSIQKVLEAYYNDNNKYPTSTENYQITNVAWGDSWGLYMKTLPKDSTLSQRYAYWAAADGSWYKLYARLERGTKDPQACSGGACGPANACGGLTCNYGVSSSNTTP